MLQRLKNKTMEQNIYFRKDLVYIKIKIFINICKKRNYMPLSLSYLDHI